MFRVGQRVLCGLGSVDGQLAARHQQLIINNDQINDHLQTDQCGSGPFEREIDRAQIRGHGPSARDDHFSKW